MGTNRNGTMDPGKMDRRIGIKREVVTTDEYNAQDKAWTVVKTIWAEVVPMKAAEIFLSGATRPERITLFRIWNDNDITEKDIIFYNDKDYNIRGFEEVGRREGLEIVAQLIE